MKILSISDTHGILPKVPDESFDIFIHGGDIAPCVTLLQNVESAYISGPATQDDIANSQMNWYKNTFVPWLHSIRAKHKIIVPGNHDLGSEKYFVDFTKLMKDAGAVVLCGPHDKLYNADGVTIYGFPWIVPVGRWAWMLRDGIREDFVNRIPDCDILVSHSPPYGIGDDVHGRNIGIPEMNKEWFATRDIAIILCGHCHECGGMSYEYNGTSIHNIAYTRENWMTAGFTVLEKINEKWIKREN